jgi:1,4-dihydroxy-2-naphthoate octaprenyltransferase
VTPSLGLWWRGARPRTLGAGVVPVLVGAAAAGEGEVAAWRLGAALVVAIGLQVGVNYANDYFDGVRGVDTPARLGPARLVASGSASPRAVLAAALIAIGIAAAAGAALAVATEPLPIFALGALALLATLLYSGGPRPYASLGLGEVMVFLCFGLFATCGTTFVVRGTVTAASWWCGATLGLLAVAILVANNLRDIPTDAAAGKRTLAVRLGERHTRALYGTLVIGAFLTIASGVLAGRLDPSIGLPTGCLLGLVAAPLAARPLARVQRARGPELVAVLTATAAVHAATGLLLALGLLWG